MAARAARNTLSVLAAIALSGAASGQEKVSVEQGLYISVIGGCHDCHTQGYREAGGKIDPTKAMKGDASIGWQSRLGVAYAPNLRLFAFIRDEDGFVQDMADLHETLPPMPWYNVRAIKEDDLRSLYRYLISLGDAGKPVPLASHEEPKTPYITIDPPTMPKK
ncbi:cytochrome C [Nordella sp. HKS 07]|uniref:cytochrome C n=1 Tax=Nordella sp. HKS 07 TaxID=2712222 RepID=UPI0013E1E99D|nr:cytochrome C [Nordella sp. HKS 07]QIG51807.1 cytochrome C [Nordella sp. HKS 07]